MFSHNPLPEDTTSYPEATEPLSPLFIQEKESYYFPFLQESQDRDLQLDSQDIFGWISSQGIPSNELLPQQENAMELENEASKPLVEKIPTEAQEPSPAKPEECEIVLPQVAPKKSVSITSGSQEGLTGSTGPSSKSKCQFLEAPPCADRNQYGNFEGEQICDDPSPKTQVGSYVSGENCSNQKPAPILADLIQHEVEDLSTRASSPQGMNVEMHPNSKNIKKEKGTKFQDLKDNEKPKAPSQSTAYKNKYIFIARSVLNLLEAKTRFQVVFKEVCGFYDVDPKGVEEYLLLRIRGSKEGGKTRTGNDQDQAKVANKTDVANLLHEKSSDSLELWLQKKGARLAFERFFMDGYYETWAEEKCVGLSEEVLDLFMKKKNEIHRDFVPDRNEFLSS